MLDQNPYRSTLLTDREVTGNRVTVVVWWLVYLHAAMGMTFIYASWMLTAAALGRVPGFGELPDDSFVYTTVYVLSGIGALLTIAGPILIPVALTLAFFQPFAKPKLQESLGFWRIACIVLYLFMLGLAYSVYVFDPLKVVYCFWD